MGFFKKFTNRLVIAELFIHGVLASLVLFLALPQLQNNYRDQFINGSETNARDLAALISRLPQYPLNLGQMETHNAGLRLIHLDPQDGSINEIEKDPGFADQNDDRYYIAVPLKLAGNDYVLQLAYDEAPTKALLNDIRQLGITVVLGYILVSMLLAALLGPQLVRPLLQLTSAVRRIAAGEYVRHLDIKSGTLEINQLIDDMEYMRRELVDQKEALATREARLSTIMANVIDGLITIGTDGKIESFNLAAERIFGYTASEIVGQDVEQLFELPFAIGENEELLDIDQIEPYETRGHRKGGHVFFLEVSINEVCQMDGCLYIAICRDISERKHHEAKIRQLQEELEARVVKRTRELADVNRELQHQALHDALTGLPNRVLMKDRVDQAIRTAKREECSVALMITDLDRFKEINDTLGHHYGDLLLQQVAVRMRSALRDSDTVARLGGDEFAVLLPNINDEEQVKEAARKIAEAIDKPFIFENQNIHVGISIGIAMYPKDNERTSKLMRQADVAMYVAKRSLLDYAFYEPEHDEHSLSRLSMAGELRQALNDKNFIIHYQPTIDLNDDTVIGVEALVRWQHPYKGLIAPDEFIPLAEQTGLVQNLTALVLEQSLSQLNDWQRSGLDLRLSINLASRCLYDTDIVEQISQLLEQWQIAPAKLNLQVTEKALMQEPAKALITLTQLHELGVSLAIDDFGTGYSNMSYLHQFPIDEIMIDRSFVHGMLNNKADLAIVHSIVKLAQNMEHRLIAEGVDEKAAIALLKQMRCDLVQGFLFSEPLPPDELLNWLEARGK